jgi:CspA family cold shock protein
VNRRKEHFMASGTIKTVRDKAFGLITPGGGGNDDLFFHSSNVENQGCDQLREGQRVGFDEEPDPRDPSRRRAVNVRLSGDDGA